MGFISLANILLDLTTRAGFNRGFFEDLEGDGIMGELVLHGFLRVEV
ncbi:MAG: hypothetical protein AB8H47_06650 [Bacteroidia bacterium]